MNTQILNTAITIGKKTVKTSAQAMTLIAYGDCNNNDLPFRSLDFKTECEDFNDLAKCLELINYYNDFDANEIIKSSRQYLSLGKYYNENNPNNGNPAFRLDIAREGSPAFYVKFIDFGGEKVIRDGFTLPYTKEDFEKDMNALQSILNADEFDIDNDGIYHTARFWWD